MTNKEHYTRLTTENRLKLIEESLGFIYSKEDSANAYEKTLALINKYKQKVESAPYYLTQKDIILIIGAKKNLHKNALATRAVLDIC